MSIRLYSLVVLTAVLVRWLVALFPYSGYKSPPMFGDFEAQRHWMEITVNLDSKTWYQNTSDNDLQYWGLDYPPLTAYHMYLCGKLLRLVNQSFVELHFSRGIEDLTLKLFMRLSVLFADLIFYIPAVLWFVLCAHTNTVPSFYQIYRKKALGAILLSAFLLYPGLILVDHGHFQYNCVSLGLTVCAVCAAGQGWNYLSAMFYTLALNYKQMELYYILPFSFYYVGSCLNKNFVFFLKSCFHIAGIVLSITLLIWWPFLFDFEVTYSVIQRILPFYRGIFEDKVANFWCSFNLFIRVKQWTQFYSVLLCTVSVLVIALPSSIKLLFKPEPQHLMLSLFNASLSFFLFSFHVHEKTILLPAIPACMLLASHPFPSFWFLCMSTISLFPLMVKDGLEIAFIGTFSLYYVLCVHQFKLVDISDLPLPKKFLRFLLNLDHYFSIKKLLNFCFYLSIGGGLFLCFLMISVKPPSAYPDLYPVALGAYCFLHFLFFLILFNLYQFCNCYTFSQAKILRNKKEI